MSCGLTMLTFWRPASTSPLLASLLAAFSRCLIAQPPTRLCQPVYMLPGLLPASLDVSTPAAYTTPEPAYRYAGQSLVVAFTRPLSNNGLCCTSASLSTSRLVYANCFLHHHSRTVLRLGWPVYMLPGLLLATNDSSHPAHATPLPACLHTAWSLLAAFSQ